MAKREPTQATKSDQSLAKREPENWLPSVGISLFSPFGLLRHLFEDLDRIGSATESVWMPALEVVDNQLVISGEKNREEEERRLPCPSQL